MNIKHFAPLAFILFAGSAGALAQGYQDAARFGMLMPQGTARSVGFGSALGSVGGDFSALSVNPAAIGIYRRGEFSFSPSIHFGNDEFTYFGNKSTDNFSAFNISNVGVVSVTGARQTSSNSWNSWGFGIGLNRLADFNRSYSYSGRNDSSAFSETFSLDANFQGLTPSELTTYEDAQQSLGNLGYQAWLIDFDSVNNFYYTLADFRQGPLAQAKTVRERGGINELVFNGGGNYGEKIMVGATLGLPIVRYKRELTFGEKDLNGTITDFQEARYQQQLSTTGVGVNLKLGVIVKPTNAFRFGAAIHTPTWYTLRDEEDNFLFANTEGSHTNATHTLLTRTFEYTMRTPWRAVVSATGFMGNWGFVSADYEFVDYASSRITFNTSENQLIYNGTRLAAQQQLANDSLKANLESASNFRIGGEARLDFLYLRAGLGFYGSPYKKSNLFGDGMKSYHAGVGYRGNRGFVDLGFVNTQRSGGEYAYQLPYGGTTGTIAPEARGSITTNNIILTFGAKF